MIGNLERAQAMMAKNDLDALIAFSSSNVFYLTGYHSLFAILSKTPSFFSVLPRGGEPELFLSAEDEGLYLTGEFQNKKKHYFGESFGSAKEKVKSEGGDFELIAKTLNRAGAGKGRIGYDGKIAPVYQYDLLRKALPGAKFVEASNVFERLRMVKTPEEIRRLKKSLSILEWGNSAAFRAVREGLTEKEFVGVFKEAALAKESESTFLQLEAGFGPRGGTGGGTFPSDYAARMGDVIHFDGGVLFDQYASDMDRCATLGPASDKARRIYDATFAAENKAISMCRPGAKISEIYEASVKMVRQRGFPDYVAGYVGHSIGLEAHEWPSFSADRDVVLEEDMVIMIEIPYYDPKVGAFIPEDCLLVTKDGPEFLTTMDRNLYEL